MNGIEVTKDTMKNIARLYKKKPLAIRAMQINQTFWVQSLEGNHQGKEGDYLVEGIKGELYICDKEIFEQIYELYYGERFASKEALSANNAKWREKIEEYKQDVPDSAGKYYKIVIPEDEWQSILSQMEGE